MTDDKHRFSSGATTAEVLAQGAELCSLRDAAEEEVMWSAQPIWPSHAPVLFPIVGELAGGTLRVDGTEYKMRRHGFARTSRFQWIRRGADGCTLALVDDAATRAQYPFPFRLELEFALHGPALQVSMIATNTGATELPCSFGFHPAFRWPLHGGAKEAYRIELSDTEDASITQIDRAGLVARRVPSPLVGDRVLHLADTVFAHDALIFQPVHSRSARLVGPSGPGLEVAWEGATNLGIWSKPADFVCIEPWHGIADPAGFSGAFRDKPGLMHLRPGQSGRLQMKITTGV